MLAKRIHSISKQISPKGISLSVILKRLEISRSTFYYKTTKFSKDKILQERIRQLAMIYKTYGYKKITVLLKKEGFNVNHKKVYRIWKEEGFNRYGFFKSKRRHKTRQKEFNPAPATYAGEILAMDFIHDSLENGRAFRVFNVIDVYSRRAFEPVVGFSISGKVVSEHLEELFRLYGPPKMIRRDDGPEFKSKHFKALIHRWNIEEEVIPPGQPFNNGHMESFHKLLRLECLNREIFSDIFEAREKINNWIEDYNTCRLHSALGYKTPEEIWKKGRE